jgi:alpha/beta superfamily hydrolase
MPVALEFEASAAKGRPAVVAPPHPLYGGHMDNPVVTVVANALADAGYSPLRFNWRGVGESTGRPSGAIEDACEDYRAAVDEALRASGAPHAHVLAAGYSFGAVAALALAAGGDVPIGRMVLVAPPVQMVEAVDLASIDAPIQVIVGESDQYASVERLADALSAAPSARLDVVPDADHFFGFGPWLEKIGELVRAAARA